MKKIPYFGAALALALCFGGAALADIAPAAEVTVDLETTVETPMEAPSAPAAEAAAEESAAPAAAARSVELAEAVAPAVSGEPEETETPAPQVQAIVPTVSGEPEETETPAPLVQAVVPTVSGEPEETETPAPQLQAIVPAVSGEPEETETPAPQVQAIVPTVSGEPEETETHAPQGSGENEVSAPEETAAAAPRLMNFVTKGIVKKGGKGSISGSVAVESGHTVVVQLSGASIPTISVELTESSDTFKFEDLDAGEYTITIYDKASPSLKLTLKQTVSDGSSDTPSAITGLAAKADPGKITVTGKAEANHAVVVGTEPATQEATVVSGSDGNFTATLSCPAGTYKVYAQYANLKDTRVTLSGSITVPEEKIDVYPTFRRGDRYHPLIYRLQQRLKELGYYTIKVDGIFGSGTERAVRLFQQVNGISPADGVATNYTQQRLYASSAKPFPGPAPAPGGGTLYRSPYYQAAAVPLQQRLRSLGYYTGSADGYYGSRTQQAVRNFQKRNGLPVTGNADPTTQARLYSSSAIPAGGGGYTPDTGYRLLYWGCRGDAVRRLQQALRNAGYTQVRAVDGIYGQWTYDAVRAFQRDHGLSVDGIAGRKTQNALYGTHY